MARPVLFTLLALSLLICAAFVDAGRHNKDNDHKKEKYKHNRGGDRDRSREHRDKEHDDESVSLVDSRCKFKTEDGVKYDLRGVAKKSKPFVYSDEEQQVGLAMTLCRGLGGLEHPSDAPTCNDPDAAVCLRQGNGTAYVAGRWPNAVVHEAPQVTMFGQPNEQKEGHRAQQKFGIQVSMNGSVCNNVTGKRHHVLINVHCWNKFKVTSVIVNGCETVIEAKGRAGCPRSDSYNGKHGGKKHHRRDDDDDDDDEIGEWLVPLLVGFGVFVLINCCLICCYYARRRRCAAAAAAMAANNNDTAASGYPGAAAYESARPTAAAVPLAPQQPMYPDLNEQQAQQQSAGLYGYSMFQPRQWFYPAFFGGHQYQPLQQMVPMQQVVAEQQPPANNGNPSLL